MNNDNQRDLIKPKMEVNTKKEKKVRLANFEPIKDMDILTYVEFKAKVR
jgi:hypothetical protein